MARAHKKMTMADYIKKFVFLTVGAVLMAVALEIFLVPNEIIDGGITGISIVLSEVSHVALGIFIFIINLPFLFIGYKMIGKTFAVSTLYGVGVMSVATALLHSVEPFTSEKILAVLYGGVILGLGIGIVIRFGGALDGSEIVAILFSKKFRLPVGQIVMFINVFIFIVAGFVFGADSAMYSIFTFYIAAKVMDIVVEGLDESKSATIISGEYEEISEAIMDRLGRNTTLIYAKGGYTKEDTQLIFCVVTRLEIAKLKSVVHEIDPRAFISVQNVADVLGGNIEKKSIH
ncbi:YitT family protein [Cohnella endophytica]|uniref:YitT family protein n=1 Tax=Cohnella endophytica TaxID=2419778 RepID=A0A494Y1R2_9BACL|nr:YitT family protein [Cohnella endophytica]RKP53806.1 YitT family protein [Cohnella endophytica]